MNENDIQLMKTMIFKIGDLGEGNKLLFATNFMQIAKINLILLKALLEELDWRGFFITIDRPHQYIEHLMRMHCINYSKLNFIDTIARFSADNLTGMDIRGNLRMLDSPFQIHLLPDMFDLNGTEVDLKVGKIYLDDVDFILIDNIASMLNYNEQGMVEQFLVNYLAKFEKARHIFVPVLIDRMSHSHLFEVARGLCDMELDVEVMANMKADQSRAMRDVTLFSQKRSLSDEDSLRRIYPGGG